MRRAMLLLFLLCGTTPRLFAQRYSDQEVPRYELGVQFGLAHIERISDALVGGARLHYNFNEHLALDSQLTSGPATTSAGGSGGQTAFLVGLRAGQRVAGSGFFLHARGGFVHYSPSSGAPPLFSRDTFPALDAGGTLEHYFGSRPWEQNMVFRVELGALIVPYGSATLISGPSPVIGSPPPPSGQLGTRVGPVLGLGIGFRF
jgi:hypothetical protein